MPTNQQLLSYSQTALASYAANLLPNTNNSAAYADDGVGMSATQATSFDAQWSVLQQSPANANGFSAVLLQNRTTGEKVLAIAGTNGWQDWIADAVVAQYGTALAMPQYASLESFHAQLVSTGKLGASEQVVVTGHSLGGVLAQACRPRHFAAVVAGREKVPACAT